MRVSNKFKQVFRYCLAVLLFAAISPSVSMAADTWEYPGKGDIKDPFGGGEGTWKNPYIIANAQHLVNLQHMVTDQGYSYQGKYFKITNDIVLNDNVISDDMKDEYGRINIEDHQEHFDKLKLWSPIGTFRTFSDDPFSGYIDGGGHSISGIYCNEVIVNGKKEQGISSWYKTTRGLFGYCKNATIKNLNIKDSYITVPDVEEGIKSICIGTLMGCNAGTTVNYCHAVNCYVSDRKIEKVVKAPSEDYIGGLIGYASDDNWGLFSDSFDGTVVANRRNISQIAVGGILGKINKGILGIMQCCYVNGKIVIYPEDLITSHETTTNYYVGGVVGYADNSKAIVITCDNRAPINFRNEKDFSGKIYLGGIGGYVRSFRTSLNYADISFFDANSAPDYKREFYVAGISASGATSVEDCQNSGNIKVKSLHQSDKIVAAGLLVNPDKSLVCTNSMTMGNLNYTDAVGTIQYDPFIWNLPKSTNITNNYYRMMVNDAETSARSQYGDDSNIVSEDDLKSKELAAKLNQGRYPCIWGIMEKEDNPIKGNVALSWQGATPLVLFGNGSEEDPVLISSESELRYLVNLINNADENSKLYKMYIKLAANIDMMDDEPLPQIVSKNSTSFKGVIDGDGHYIRGIKSEKGSLIYNLLGTVKNLALLDFQNESSYNYTGAIAERLGDYSESGTIQNCYVTGDLEYSGTDDVIMGGIAACLYPKGKIENSYFVGSIKLKDSKIAGSNSCIAGVVPFCYDTNGKYGEINNSYAVVSYDKSTSSLNDKFGPVIAFGNPTISNNQGVVTYVDGSKPSIEKTIDGVTIQKDEADIHAADLGEAWMEGRHHPVLKSAYHYECTDYQGNTVGLDPVYRSVTDNNDFLTLVPRDDQKTDTQMWQLAKLAVYSETFDTYYATEFDINPQSEIRYKAAKEGVKLMGTAAYKITAKIGDNWYSLCLPGVVNRASFQEDVKLYLGGKLADGKMNLVEVDSVPAAVPFFMYYKNDDAAEASFYVTSVSELKLTPQKASENSDLTGTFAQKRGDNLYAAIVDEDGKLTLQKQAAVSPFCAYVESDGEATDIELTKYLLLDEQSNHTEDVLAAYKGQTVDVKLRRDIKMGGWNTLCLPFSVDQATISSQMGAQTRMEQLSSVSYDDATQALVMKFAKASSIEAGKPYLVYPEKAGSLFDFMGCQLTNEEIPTTFENISMGDNSLLTISMMGTYDKVYLMSTEDEDDYFLQQDKFYRATEEQPVSSLGYRCWFKVTSINGTQTESLQAARLIHSDGSTTDVKLINAGKAQDGSIIYDLRGIQHGKMQQGINILGGKKVIKMK